MCQNALIGRIILSKGESPWKLVDLRKKLTDIWRITSNWKLISLGRGYYHVILNSISEKNSVWSNGAIMLKPVILRLQHWSPDFDSSAQKSTNTQIDNATNATEFGHYVRVLIDIDLCSTLLDNLLIETVGKNFFIEVIYENLPLFCTSCSNIGHHPRDCRLNRKQAEHVSIDKPAVQAKIWKQKHQNNEDIPIEHVFKHLQTGICSTPVNSVPELNKETTVEPHKKAEIVSVSENLNKVGKLLTGDSRTVISKEISVHEGTLIPQRWEDLVDSDSSKDTSDNLNANIDKGFETVGFQDWSNNMQEEEYWITVQRKNSEHQKKFKVVTVGEDGGAATRQEEVVVVKKA
ncbi:uncharacterized protein LOC126672913 [Mercurialis annua]|uniref:uncharacterized protein LOC126672913 n=1 Tax=Mercurialis annua TaxID=3986 RepID=UPI00215FA44C|nr:uncharacterized protein LOC126672913 [Mercurialis annua]